jgi:capsular exopolysaccharide synthesis family protein
MRNQSTSSQQIDLRDYWRVLVKRRWIVITFLLVVVVATAIFSLTETPIYRGTAQLLIEKNTLNVLPTNEMVVVDTSGPEFYKTQNKILESRSLAREVIKRLNLVLHPELKDELQKKGDASLTVISEAPSAPGTASIDDSAIVGSFLKRLKVELIRDSRLVSVGFESFDPSLAAQVANTLVQAYIDWNLGLRIKAQQNVSIFLDDQVKEARRRLEASEQALQQYREKYGVAVISGQTGKGAGGQQDVSRQKLMQVNAQWVDAIKHRIEVEIEYKNALEFLKDAEKAESIPEAVNNPVIIAIKQQEVNLLREKAEKSEKFGPKHHIMVSLNQEIENLRKKKLAEIKNIVEAMKAKYNEALTQEHSLQGLLVSSQNETISRDKVAIQYQVLEQEAESNRSLYDMLLKRLKETNVTEESRAINIHVVDMADIPKVPVKPRIKLNILLAVLTGLIMGGGLAFFMEYLDNTIKTPEDLKNHFNLPYLGSVPNYKAEDPHLVQSELIVLNNPKSTASEAYRGVRTGILFSTPGHSPRSMLITSAWGEEGKTVTCANLAITMAQAGQKILMLDCDMRRPSLHKIFNLPNERGISNILVGDCSWRDTLHSSLVIGASSPLTRNSSPVTNLSIITSGPIPPNPAELMGSDRMQDLIKEVSGEYERVILDCSPIMGVTDPVVLSRFVEGVVLVIKAGETVRDLVATSLHRLQDVQAHVLGAILNNVNVGKNHYYYYQYYCYYYGEDGGRKKKKSKKSTPSKEPAQLSSRS